MAKAVLIALKRNPELNSSWDEAAQEIVLKGGVNLGIAAATPRGLIVPNIKDADRLSLLELAQAFGTLVALARSGQDPAGRPGPRQLHDHQHRGLRGRRWSAHPQPG